MHNAMLTCLADRYTSYAYLQPILSADNLVSIVLKTKPKKLIFMRKKHFNRNRGSQALRFPGIGMRRNHLIDIAVEFFKIVTETLAPILIQVLAPLNFSRPYLIRSDLVVLSYFHSRLGIYQFVSKAIRAGTLKFIFTQCDVTTR